MKKFLGYTGGVLSQLSITLSQGTRQNFQDDDNDDMVDPPSQQDVDGFIRGMCFLEVKANEYFNCCRRKC